MEINTITPGLDIDSTYKLKSYTLGFASNGTKYANLVLRDSTGDIAAKWFDLDEEGELVLKDAEFLSIKAKSEQRAGNVQLKIRYANSIEVSEVDRTKYDPASFLPIDVMKAKLEYNLSIIENKHIKELAIAIYNTYSTDYLEFPASITNHHNFKHGLLQHSLEVLDTVLTDFERLPSWAKVTPDKDLLIIGALFHDLGKLQEYKRKNSEFDFNSENQLIGHIVLGVEMITKVASTVNTPSQILSYIKHIVLSHHGKRSLGSPVEPLLLEAQLIADADYKSASMQHWGKALNTTYADEGPFQYADKLISNDPKCYSRKVYIPKD